MSAPMRRVRDAKGMRGRLPLLAAIVATVSALWVIGARARIDPDVAALIPDQGSGAALQQYVRAFGGGDLGLVLLRGNNPEQVSAAAAAATEALRACPRVRAALHRLRMSPSSDPSLAWAWADEGARRALQQAFDPETMRSRLGETRSLLLGPGAASLASEVTRDPLRLREIPLARRSQLAAGASASSSGWMASSGGELMADEGRARLVVFAAEGQALRGRDARAITESVERCLAPVREAHHDVTMGLTGGHAIASATEAMIRRDLQWSSVASLVLASVVFALTFRRLRALVAVMPPLALGTLWTAAAGAVVFDRLSAISTAFVAVVVGVGVDTGVHVYAALLDARRRGLAPRDAARDAIDATARPTLVAALTAGAAFGSLALSSIEALQQLGVLCAIGELFTALAILLVTPWVGAWLERGPPPDRRAPAWTGLLRRWTSAGPAPVVVALACALPAAGLLIQGLPRVSDTLFALRPESLAPVRILQEAFEWFGGGSQQWVVLVQDRDLQRARRNADRLYERFASSPELVESFDGLTAFAPCEETQRGRLAERDAIDLPARIPELRRSLEEVGLVSERFGPVFAWMASPSRQTHDALAEKTDEAALLSARFVAQDGGQWLVASHVRPRAGREREVEALVASVESGAVITGYARLDSALRTALVRDLPRIGLVAALLVLAAMGAALRSLREVGIAAATLGFEALWILAVVRVAGIRVHAYDVMVLPVLLGVTVDEVMFLLHRARKHGMAESLRREGPNVVSTGATTAAGFGALVFCQYEALADMGRMGLAGVLIGLAAALLIVPVLGANRGPVSAPP